MKLQLLDAIGEITEARTAAGLWQQGQGCSLTGLSGASKTVFLAALDRLLPEQGSLVFLLSGRDDIREYRRIFELFLFGFADAGIVSCRSADGAG